MVNKHPIIIYVKFQIMRIMFSHFVNLLISGYFNQLLLKEGKFYTDNNILNDFIKGSTLAN